MPILSIRSVRQTLSTSLRSLGNQAKNLVHYLREMAELDLQDDHRPTRLTAIAINYMAAWKATLKLKEHPWLAEPDYNALPYRGPVIASLRDAFDSIWKGWNLQRREDGEFVPIQYQPIPLNTNWTPNELSRLERCSESLEALAREWDESRPAPKTKLKTTRKHSSAKKPNVGGAKWTEWNRDRWDFVHSRVEEAKQKGLALDDEWWRETWLALHRHNPNLLIGRKGKRCSDKEMTWERLQTWYKGEVGKRSRAVSRRLK
jgi:hypothetical protein